MALWVKALATTIPKDPSSAPESSWEKETTNCHIVLTFVHTYTMQDKQAGRQADMHAHTRTHIHTPLLLPERYIGGMTEVVLRSVFSWGFLP